MSYTLTYGQNGNTALVVQDGDSATVGNLTFPGRNFSGYGSPVDQNFLSLVENFTSSGNTGPTNPVQGQLWNDVASANANANLSGVKYNSGSKDQPVWKLIPEYINGNTRTLAVGELRVGDFSSSATIRSNVANNINSLDSAGVTNTKITNVSVTSTTGSFSGNVTAANLTATTNLTANVLTVNQTSTFSGDVTVAANTNTTINGTLNVAATGSANISGPLRAFGIFDLGNATVTLPSNVTIPVTPAISSPIYKLGYANANATNITQPSKLGTELYYYPGNTLASETVGFTGLNYPLANDSTTEFVMITSGANSGSPVYGNLHIGNLKAVAVNATLNGNVGTGLSNIVIGANSSSSANTAGNINFKVNGISDVARITQKGIIVSSNLTSTLANANSVSADYFYGNFVGTLSSGSGANSNVSLSNVTLANGVITANSANFSSTVNAVGITSTTTITATGNLSAGNISTSGILSAGATTVTSLSATGTISGATGNLTTVNTGTLAASGTGNTGTISGKWTLSTGSTMQATYADLAERHHSDAEYPTGTVMTVGGTNEVTAASNNSKVLGVVSAEYAYLMNEAAGPQETHPAVAYVGRVPVRVVGAINKHDIVSPADGGVAIASDTNGFGWAIETNLDPAEKLVLCIIK